MPMVKYLILLIFIISCAHKKVLRKELSLVIGCTIYDLDGKVLSSYPGEECVFFEDGSFITYDSKNRVLQRYDKKLSSVWSLNAHVHHGIHQTKNGDLLVNSSVINNKVRYDVLLLISPDGIIKKSYSFESNLAEIKKNFPHDEKFFKPYKADWDKNLNFTSEYTHLAASYEVQGDIKGFASSGSYLLTLNSLGRGAYVLAEDFSSLISYRKLPTKIFHDVQRYSETEIVYFVNSTSEDKAHIEIFDVVQNKVTRTIEKDFFAYFAGAVQLVDQHHFLVTDSNSNKGADPVLTHKGPLSIEERVKLSQNNFSRVIFMTDKGDIIKELHFDFKFNSARLVDVQSFLANNIRL